MLALSVESGRWLLGLFRVFQCNVLDSGSTTTAKPNAHVGVSAHRYERYRHLILNATAASDVGQCPLGGRGPQGRLKLLLL